FVSEVHAVGREHHVEEIVAVALPGDVQLTVEFAQRGALRTSVAESHLVRKASRRWIDIHARDIQIIVTVAFPRDHQVPVERSEYWRFRAGLARDEFSAESRSVIGRDHHVYLIVAVAPPGQIQIAAHGSKRRAERARIAEDHLVQETRRV